MAVTGNGDADPSIGPVPRDGAEVAETIGVEEEFHILDPSTADAAPDVLRIMESENADPTTQPELLRSVVEVSTAVCRTLDELRAELVMHRSALLSVADRAGLWLAAAGTVPHAGARPIGVYPTARYQRMAEEYQQLVAEQMVCACQVQIGVPDRDLALSLTARIRVWLPVLLALSASSPFFRRGDSGYASYRSIVWSRWPTAGPIPRFESSAEYETAVDELISSGTITDAGMVYFDVRPSNRYPTLEIRIADACPLVDDAVLIAALGRALVAAAAIEEAARLPVPRPRPELLRAANWRAARSGMTGMLVDPLSATAVPANVLLDRMLTHLEPVLADRGEWPTVVELVKAHRYRGTSAERQRAAFARDGRLRDVVEALVAETGTGF